MMNTVSCIICAFIVMANFMGVFASSLLDGKIVNGDIVTEKKIDFLGSLRIYYSTEEKWEHIGVGSLISSNILITSGYCVITIREEGGDLFGNAAVFFENNMTPENPGIKYRIEDVMHYTDFSTSPANFDIGIILAKPTDHMTVKQHIPLAYFYIHYNTRGTILSWESCKATGKPFEIRQMGITIMGQESCRNEFENTTTIDDQIQMCGKASKTQKAQKTSWGDGGSPLVKYDKIIGVISFVTGMSKTPTVFSRVHDLKPFIDFATEYWHNKYPREECPIESHHFPLAF